ncbi:hypothetical protein P5V15_005489 [Pogonomyrmex californicus]
MNGVIWNKMKETFVPISSVPMYAMLQQERLRQSRILETHNFQLQNLTLTSFQEPYFFEFYDNDTKVTGLCGELWNLLSERLNFTLQPIRSNETGLGGRDKLTLNYPHGLLNVILRNKTMAIPKLETYTSRLVAADFTMPFWMNSQRLYIHHEAVHDSTWMAKVFSWKIWCCILVTYLLLSVCSFGSQIILARFGNNYRYASIGDHMFYIFGMICNQSHIPDILVGRPKILELSLGFFCSVLYMAFGAVLFIFITKRVNVIPPFHNLDSLRTDTTYNIVILKNSLGNIAFEKSPEQEFVRIRMAKRVNIALTAEQMYKMACGTKKGTKKYIIFQGEDEYKTRDKVLCHTIPIGISYMKMWIASGIVKNFKYKRAIDLGILKLKEIGFWDVLRDRWLYERLSLRSEIPEAIGMDQVFLIILMMCCGVIIALIIFVIEKLMYAYKFKPS